MFHLPFKFIENKGCNIMSTQVSPLEFAAVTREAQGGRDEEHEL